HLVLTPTLPLKREGGQLLEGWQAQFQEASSGLGIQLRCSGALLANTRGSAESICLIHKPCKVRGERHCATPQGTCMLNSTERITRTLLWTECEPTQHCQGRARPSLGLDPQRCRRHFQFLNTPIP